MELDYLNGFRRWLNELSKLSKMLSTQQNSTSFFKSHQECQNDHKNKGKGLGFSSRV